MNEPKVFTRRGAGGGCYGLIIILMVFPIMAIASFLGPSWNAIGSGLIVATVALAALVFFGIRMEYRVELGPSSLRHTERETYFGIGRPVTVRFEIPLTDQTIVKQVNTRTPSSRGGWNHGSALHFPGGHVLPDAFLGSREIPDSEYNRLLVALRERLGDRLTVEDKV